MKRLGNFFYRLRPAGQMFLVHRGVSQGGKKLSAQTRQKFWAKNQAKTLAGGHFKENQIFFEENGSQLVKLTSVDLQIMRQRNLVLISNSSNPRVWTAARVLKLAQKIQTLDESPQPRGGNSRPALRQGRQVL